MYTVGDTFPTYSLQACVDTDMTKAFKTISDTDFQGQWKVLFFWPKDFTFVCPTEIVEFGEKSPEFARRNAVVLGCSTDSEFAHLAWRNSHPQLKTLPIPMISDIKRELSTTLGILHKTEGVCMRATFIVDPGGVIRWAECNDLKVGRNVDEVLRVVDALQTDQLAPCGWKPGQKLIQP